MTKTLDQYTPEERAHMVGRWAAVEINGLVIITGIEDETARYIFTDHPTRWGFTGIQHLTPRLDLPRAWTPDGTPPQGRWQPGGIAVGLDRIHPMKYGDDTHRRFITEWEPTP